MRVTNLASILRGAGLTVVETSGWSTRSLNRTGLASRIRAVMYHDTQTADAAFDGGANVPTLNYVISGLGYPLYNVLFGRNGTAYLIAAGSAAHAGNGTGGGMTRNNANREALALSFDSNQSRYPVTAAQLEAGARAGKALSDHFGGLNHIMHGEWNPRDRSDPTRIPGGWAALRRAVQRGSWSGSTPASPTPTPPTGGLTMSDISTILRRLDNLPDDIWNHKTEKNGTTKGHWLRWARDHSRNAQTQTTPAAIYAATFGQTVKSLVSGAARRLDTMIRYSEKNTRDTAVSVQALEAGIEKGLGKLSPEAQEEFLEALHGVLEKFDVVDAADIAEQLRVTVKED